MINRDFQGNHGDAAEVLNLLAALTFFMRFVLAQHYSQLLPIIDWSADNSTVITAISHVEYESVRDHLSKEFAARGAKNGQMPHRFGNAVL